MISKIKFRDANNKKRIEPEKQEQEQQQQQQDENVLPIYHVYQHKYKRSRLKTLFDTKGFTNRNTLIENERCAADLMYAMFKRPSTVMPKLLAGLIEVIKKKNSPDLGQSRMFREAVNFLTVHPHASDRIKVFNVLLILNREPEAVEVFKAGYIADHKGNLFGKTYATHLDVFLFHLRALVHNTFTFPFGEPNVVDVVHKFVAYAEQIYLQK